MSICVPVENCVYTCLLFLTSSHWQLAFGWLSVNSSKSFRIYPCSSPVILKVVCCVGRISAFAAADFEMPDVVQHCRVAQRCTNFPAFWELRQHSWHLKVDVKQVHYQGPTLQSPLVTVTWLPWISHPWTSPCSACLSKGTALFFSFCLPVTKLSWHHEIYAWNCDCSELWADVLTFPAEHIFFTPKYRSFMTLCEIVFPVQCYSTAALIGH